jgi:hypothetical protein
VRPLLFVSITVVLGASACGARTGLGSLLFSDDGGHADAGKPHDGAADGPTVFDATPPDATGTDAAVFFCTPGVYYLEVTDDAGTRTLSSLCPGGTVPSAGIGACGGEDLTGCVSVGACGGGERMGMTSTMVDWIPPGSSGAWSNHTDDAGNHFNSGTLTIDDWPGTGGTVAGTYTEGPLSGKFCVRQE